LRLAVVSDVHGNVEALRVVLRRIEVLGADVVLVAGDLAAHGPRPVETLEVLRALGDTLMIRGNTDRYLVNPDAVPLPGWPARDVSNRLASLEWTREQLGREGLRFLAGCPPRPSSTGFSWSTALPGATSEESFPPRRWSGSTARPERRCWPVDMRTNPFNANSVGGTWSMPGAPVGLSTATSDPRSR
jgi:3',5'-cyclic AMP phosphodiesterase CpdA